MSIFVLRYRIRIGGNRPGFPYRIYCQYSPNITPRLEGMDHDIHGGLRGDTVEGNRP